jgi:hypothetical protein
MFTRDVVKAVTRLGDGDIQYVLTVCLQRSVKGPLTAGELLVLMVYDLLKQLGFSTEHLTALTMHCKDRILELGKKDESCEKGDEIRVATLQILDNQWVMMSGDEEVYNFRRMESAPRIGVPVLSLAIVLPRLYQRALSTLERRPRQPTGGEARPPVKPGGEGAS